MPTIIARQVELDRLEKIYQSHQAELLAVYGRRRVGKTYLIRQAYKERGHYFEFTGIHNASLRTQLNNFAITLSDTFYDGDHILELNDWLTAITELRKAISRLPTHDRIVIFLDELPWIATPKSGALVAIEHLWNRYFSQDPRILMILCGSAAAWMIQKVIHNRGGLHGRLTHQMQLKPFNLHAVDQYLRAQHIQIDHKQLLEVYFAFGGIPKYLSYIERGKSVAQNINDICFTQTGGLTNEFNTIYQALFKDAEKHLRIVTTLAKHPAGLSQPILLDKANISSGGTASKILQELVESGFILEIPSFTKQHKDKTYKLIDEYSLFYLRWMQGVMSSGFPLDKNYWQKMSSTPAWRSWAGTAFENTCLKHIQQIKSALGIAGVMTYEGAWRATSNADAPGAQIDLIIDRADNCINLIECKFYNKLYALTQKEVEDLKRKRISFIQSTGTKKTVFITLITAYGALENDCYHQIIDSQISIEALFSA